MFTTPVETPVTTPRELTVAMPGAPLVQLPPPGVPVSVMVVPTHTAVGPTMTSAGLTINEVVA